MKVRRCPVCDGWTVRPIIDALAHFRPITFRQWHWLRGTFKTFGLISSLCLLSPVFNTLWNWKYRKARPSAPPPNGLCKYCEIQELKASLSDSVAREWATAKKLIAAEENYFAVCERLQDWMNAFGFPSVSAAKEEHIRIKSKLSELEHRVSPIDPAPKREAKVDMEEFYGLPMPDQIPTTPPKGEAK